MANRIMLNETSYHGAGAIQEMDDVEAIFVTKDGEIHRSY